MEAFIDAIGRYNPFKTKPKVFVFREDTLFRVREHPLTKDALMTAHDIKPEI